MNCPKCNEQINGRFCPECGYDTSIKKQCPACGAEISGRFCESCGYDGTKKNKKGPFIKRHKIACVIAVLLVLCMAAAVPFVMNMMNNYRADVIMEIGVGYNKAQVENLLGKPDKETKFEWVYVDNDNLKEVEKLGEEAMEALMYGELERAEALMEEYEEKCLRYGNEPFACVEIRFDEEEKVDSVLFNPNKSYGKEYKPTGVTRAELGSRCSVEAIMIIDNGETEIVPVGIYEDPSVGGGRGGYSVEYSDGGCYCGHIDSAAFNAEKTVIIEHSSEFGMYSWQSAAWIDSYSKLECVDESYGSVLFVAKIIDGVLMGYYVRSSDNSVIIPDIVTAIGDGAFKDRDELIGVTIPDSVISIGDGAFEDCENLKSITIPDSVISIGDGAFYNCPSLESNEYEGGCYLGSEENPYLILYEINDKEATSFEINQDTRFIGEDAFHRCDDLESITIPSGVTKIGDGVFCGLSGLKSIFVEEENESYKSIDGSLYTKDGKTLITYAAGRKESSFTIPDCVTDIDDFAFLGCSKLTNIVIPNSVTRIGETFDGCQELMFNEYENGLYLGNDENPYLAFVRANEEEITSIKFGESTRIICKSALMWQSELTSVIIPETVISISDEAFSGCFGLANITIPNSVISIGDRAFGNCENLKSVTIPNSVTSIGNEAFSGSGLASITISDSVISIGDRAFSWCNSLVSITIPDSVTSIGAEAFIRCDALKSVIIGNGVTKIGDEAFSMCEALESVTIGSGVTRIGRGVLGDCRSLTSVTFKNTTGWKYNGIAVEVTDSSENAKNFCDCWNLWTRNP